MTRQERCSFSCAALACAALLFAVGCSSSDDPAADAGPPDTAPPRSDGAPPPDPDGPAADQGAPDPDQAGGDLATPDQGSDGPTPDQAVLPEVNEQEPNDGASATELNDVTAPVKISGTIGQANDADIFRFAATAGERYVVRVLSAGDLEAHIAIFGEAPVDVPPVVNRGPGKDGMAELYVLETGNYFLAVRDRRNVGSGGAGVGGATFGYTATIEPLTRAPIPAVVGGEVSGQLDPPGVVRVFSFTANPDDELKISAIAQQLTPPSDVDTRLTLFHPGQTEWMGTNDNPSLSETDSRLEGPMYFSGTFHAIVENVAESGSDYRFKLKIEKISP